MVSTPARIVALGALTLAYLLWLAGDRFYVAIVGLGLLSVALYALLAGALLVIVSNLLLVVMPHRLRAHCSRHKTRWRLALLLSLSFAIGFGWLLNRYWLPHRLHPLSIASDLVVVATAFVIAWTVLRPTPRKAVTLAAAGAVFAGFVVVLAVLGEGPGLPSRPVSARTLAALPYVTWTPVDDNGRESGVTLHDEERSWAGVNLFNSWNLASAWLIDMDGNVLHEWAAPMANDDRWPYIEPGNDGTLYAVAGDRMLVCVGWDSAIEWVKTMRCHHDIAIAPGGDIYVLGREDAFVRHRGIPMPFVDDTIVVLSPERAVERRISLYDVFAEQLPAATAWRVYHWLLNPFHLRQTVQIRRDNGFWFGTGTPLDGLHTNTLEIIDRDLNDVVRRGRLLVCARELDAIGIIDEESAELVWSWGPGELQRPHHPTVLDNGNILVFDNGARRRYSRIIELDPVAREIVWEYTATPRTDFFSHRRGGNQRLPNGNTLVTSSDAGRVFEVPPGGDIVWEFFNPVTRNTATNGQVLRAAIYRMMRIPEAQARAWLEVSR